MHPPCEPADVGGPRTRPGHDLPPASSPWGVALPWPGPRPPLLSSALVADPWFLPCDGRAHLHAQPGLFAQLLVGSLSPLPREDLVPGPGVGTCACPQLPYVGSGWGGALAPHLDSEQVGQALCLQPLATPRYRLLQEGPSAQP